MFHSMRSLDFRPNPAGVDRPRQPCYKGEMTIQNDGPDLRPIFIKERVYVPVEHVIDPLGIVQELTFKNANYKPKAEYTYYGIPGKKGGLRLIGRDERVDYSQFQMAQFVDDDYLAVPRSYDIFSKLRALPEGVFYTTRTPFDNGSPFRHVTLGKDNIVLGPNSSIRYDQGPAWEALHTPNEYPYGRTLVLGCGKGKTVLALKHAFHRHVPTLVVCHTRQMCSAWSDTAAAPWALSLPYSRHGFIGDGKIDWRGKDIVFSTMPGLVCREYPQEFWDYFGLVIFDEGDLLGATELSQVLPKFLGERLLLTATIERPDGHDELYYNHVGPICFYDDVPDLSPRCVVLDSAVPAIDGQGREVTQKIWWRSPGGGPILVPHIPKTLTNITRLFPERRNWAMQIVKDLLDEGRKVLFLGERVAELKAFDRRSKLEWPEYKSGLTLGGQHTTPAEIDEVLKSCDIIWGIQHIAKRGLNKPSIDTIVIQYSCFRQVGRLKQTIGRALRYHEGKKAPLVVILNDPQIEVFDNMARTLYVMLQQLGYEMSWHTPEAGAFYTTDEHHALEELYGVKVEPLTGLETWEGMDEEEESDHMTADDFDSFLSDCNKAAAGVLCDTR